MYFRKALEISEAIISHEKYNGDWMALAVKAESLFNMCDFEHAMIFYIRAQKSAPTAVRSTTTINVSLR